MRKGRVMMERMDARKLSILLALSAGCGGGGSGADSGVPLHDTRNKTRTPPVET